MRARRLQDAGNPVSVPDGRTMKSSAVTAAAFDTAFMECRLVDNFGDATVVMLRLSATTLKAQSGATGERIARMNVRDHWIQRRGRKVAIRQLRVCGWPTFAGRRIAICLGRGSKSLPVRIAELDGADDGRARQQHVHDLGCRGHQQRVPSEAADALSTQVALQAREGALQASARLVQPAESVRQHLHESEFRHQPSRVAVKGDLPNNLHGGWLAPALQVTSILRPRRGERGVYVGRAGLEFDFRAHPLAAAAVVADDEASDLIVEQVYKLGGAVATDQQQQVTGAVRREDAGKDCSHCFGGGVYPGMQGHRDMRQIDSEQAQVSGRQTLRARTATGSLRQQRSDGGHQTRTPPAGNHAGDFGTCEQAIDDALDRWHVNLEARFCQGPGPDSAGRCGVNAEGSEYLGHQRLSKCVAHTKQICQPHGQWQSSTTLERSRA